MLPKRCLRLINKAAAREPDAADIVFDLCQRIVCRLRQPSIDRSEVGSRFKFEAVLRLQHLNGCRTIARAASPCAGPNMIKKNWPQLGSAIGLIWRQSKTRPLARPVLVIGPRGFEIEIGRASCRGR